MEKTIRIFRLFLYLLVFRIQSTASQVVLEICADADLGNACILTCTTPDNAQYISFLKTSDLLSTLGGCFQNGGGCSVSDVSKYAITQSGGVTNFTILSHSKLDAGTWRCDYGGTFNDASLKWAKLPTTISTSTGIFANTVVNQASSIPVTVSVGCLYSENAPNVAIQYLPGTHSSVMTCAKSATVCSDPDLSAYDCSKTITSGSATCGGTLYTMQLKVSVSHTRNTFQQQLFAPYTIKFDCLPTTVSTLFSSFPTTVSTLFSSFPTTVSTLFSSFPTTVSTLFSSFPTTVSTTSTTLNSTTAKPPPNPVCNTHCIIIIVVAVVSGAFVIIVIIVVVVVQYNRRQHDRKEHINMK